MNELIMESLGISELVLFISSMSEQSQICVKSISPALERGLNMSIVRLDTEEARSKVMNGDNLTITWVPTLLVTYSDGNIQQFIGVEKIFKWTMGMIQTLQQSQSQPQNYGNDHPQNFPENNKVKKKKKGNENTNYEDEGGVEIEFVSSKPQTEGLLLGKQSPLGKSVSKGNKMKDLRLMAQQMEKDRQNSLGYKEEDLPRFS